MRYESSVTSLSWIPSEAVTGASRLAFDSGLGHYDEPPPDHLGDVEALRAADRFRFANVLRAWIEVGEDGQIDGAGYAGGGLMGSTTVRLAGLRYRFQAAQLEDIRREPEYGPGWVRFQQTVGGRTGAPMPRPVKRPPYVQWLAPLVWTTLALTLHADGRAEAELTGASAFPRHWVYGADGALSHKSGLTDFAAWSARSFGQHSPWGDEDSPALVTAVETALERALSVQLMHGAARPNVQSPRRPPGPIGKCGGDMPRASTAAALSPPSCSGSSSVTRASSRSPARKNGSPCTWSQCRWVSRMVPSKGRLPSRPVTRRSPVPASRMSTGPGPSSWLIATHEVCPP